jgi:uncharacterized protein (TIGR00251 family)
MITPTPDGILLTIRASPRSGRSGVAGVRGDALLVRLQASPVEGAANDELIELIASALGVPKRAVSITVGSRSRNKLVRVSGIDLATATSRLLKTKLPGR